MSSAGEATIIRYPRSLLLELQHSPLVQKPECLPNVAELMSVSQIRTVNKTSDGASKGDALEGKPRSHAKNGEVTADRGGDVDLHSLRSKPSTSGSLPRTSAVGEKTIVFGPPKMNFASAQSTGNKPVDHVESKSGAKPVEDFPRPPKYSVAERMASRQSNLNNTKQRENGATAIPTSEPPQRRLSVSDRSSDRGTRNSERPTTGRDSDKLARDSDRVNSSGATSKIRMGEPGSWRDRMEGPSARSAMGKAVLESRYSGGTRRQGRDQQPEWMTADMEKLKLESTSSPSNEPHSSASGEDDIQRFKAQMRNRERLARLEAGDERMNVTPAEELVPSNKAPQSMAKENDGVDSFFDMGFDFNKVDVGELFEGRKSEQAGSGHKFSERSRFARFWSDESETDSQMLSVLRPEHANENMQRIVISDLFDAGAAGLRDQSARTRLFSQHHVEQSTSSGILPGPRHVLSEDDVISRYRAKQRVLLAEEDIITRYKSKQMGSGNADSLAPSYLNENSTSVRDVAMDHRRVHPIRADPSEEDRAGINRVMEKLAFFGMSQTPIVNEEPQGLRQKHQHMNQSAALRTHSSDHPSIHHTYSIPPQSQFYEREQGPRPQAQSLYRSTMNMGLPDDPTSQLTAMIQAASKAKQNHQSPQDGLRPLKQTVDPVDFLAGDTRGPPAAPNVMFVPPFGTMGHPIRPGLGHGLQHPPVAMRPSVPPFLPNGPVPFIPPHLLPPGASQFPPQPPLLPGMFPPGSVPPYGIPGVPPPYPVFMNPGVPLPPMKPPPVDDIDKPNILQSAS
ncbi:hypothetical protein SpCBS45565_g05173 [Spizellomyces sp. 'palustris']|nr:hypothetical protein SpCBS45565_g05173 [Spizellomyces sp. 'palustris']